MYRNLIPALSGRYHVIAPDYPGFGQSGTPDRKQFDYRFARFAEVVDELLVHLEVSRYALYVQDYGAPVGYRLALKHPERVTALIVQNGNAYTEGLRDFWKPIKAYWADGSLAHREALRAGLTLAATKAQYLGGVRDPSRIDPDNWVHDQALLDRPGIDEIMLDLFKDYGENVALYPQFQAFFRARRPPTLIVWGKNDVIFPAEGALVPPRSASSRAPPPRHRALRARRQRRRDRRSRASLLGTQAVSSSGSAKAAPNESHLASAGHKLLETNRGPSICSERSSCGAAARALRCEGRLSTASFGSAVTVAPARPSLA